MFRHACSYIWHRTIAPEGDVLFHVNGICAIWCQSIVWLTVVFMAEYITRLRIFLGFFRFLTADIIQFHCFIGVDWTSKKYPCASEKNKHAFKPSFFDIVLIVVLMRNFTRLIKQIYFSQRIRLASSRVKSQKVIIQQTSNYYFYRL